MSLILSGFSADAQISFHTVWRDVETWGLHLWIWRLGLTITCCLNGKLDFFFGFGYSPDFSRNMLFFPFGNFVQTQFGDFLAVCQEFPSAKQSLPGAQHCTLLCFAAGVRVCGLGFCCTCARAAGCKPWFNLCSETVSWSHPSWDRTLFPTASSNVWMAVNASMGNTHAPHKKRNRLFPFLAKIKWQRHTQLPKESIQERVCGLSLPPQFSAAKSKLPLQKNPGYQQHKWAGLEKT